MRNARYMALALSALLLTQCARGIRESEVGPDSAKNRIIIASYASEFKKGVTQGLIDRYRSSVRVRVVPIEKLNSIVPGNYDAVVVIDQLMAWQMFNPGTRWFLGSVKDPAEMKKIVLYFTAGDPKENYSMMGVDCITGASVRGGEAKAVGQIAERIDRILKNP
ncbi:MAG: hypothetical protein JW807_06075 [Spirochaetes bacterium]|nr:hypothetical protein [Spirochaetota bacterium]